MLPKEARSVPAPLVGAGQGGGSRLAAAPFTWAGAKVKCDQRLAILL